MLYGVGPEVVGIRISRNSTFIESDEQQAWGGSLDDFFRGSPHV